MDPITAAVVGGKILGGLFGSRSKKKAAKRRFRRQVKRIKRESRQQQEDLLSQTLRLQGSIMASMGATGARTTSGSFARIREHESGKMVLRRGRILEAEKEAIAEAAAGKKAAIKAANYEMFGAILSAGATTAQAFGASPTSSSYYVAPSTAGNYSAGMNINPTGRFDYQSGMAFRNQSPHFSY